MEITNTKKIINGLKCPAYIHKYRIYLMNTINTIEREREKERERESKLLKVPSEWHLVRDHDLLNGARYVFTELSESPEERHKRPKSRCC